ncbi:sulfatase-like hydrolase/transferase [Microbacterium sp.]|uniref:sulfatase-like hydrolase/transferase n=1 Tax=Microbacterium sp. TaxID=51671 RepID=UPI001AD1312A|nr:sulfatase-like hydrolase/transferase [Microbacterium sp.]MBN9157076.1 sulfatase-like hydrolase/transferase [Microbacterium sp.]MBS1899855.1 sulfatase-like hydrolase/transferase [Actinomycetota bacterium]
MTRPNVVVIYADDLGYGDVGCFGGDDVRTPHLDRLAARGVRLTNWYSNSPVCSPSRAALLTGRHPVHAGVQEILGGKRGTAGLPAQPTLASRLQDEGYRTGIFGKWHLGTGSGYRPLDRGFAQHFGFLAGCVDYYSHIFYWGQGQNPVHDLWDDEREVYDNGRYLTEVIAEKAASFIADGGAEPFLCYVPFNAPHYPMHAPKEYVDRFPELPDDRRIMAAMIAAMDDGVGRILDALEAAGIADDTIVFFSSDNGPSTESRNWLNGEEIDYQGGSTGGLRGNKGSLFDGGIRVPAIISWPAALPQGAEWAEPAAMMDILPTVLEAAGAPSSAEADGTSVLGALRALAPLPDERTLFWEYGPQLAARRGPWKLTTSAREHLGGPFTLGSTVLANLDDDPAEAADLSAAHPEIAAALRAELEAWARTFDWDPAPWL